MWTDLTKEEFKSYQTYGKVGKRAVPVPVLVLLVPGFVEVCEGVFLSKL